MGLAEKFSVRWMPAAYQDAVAFAILVAVLVVRPRGLFGARESSAVRES